MRKMLIGLSSFAIIFALAAVPAMATKPAASGKSAAAKGGAQKGGGKPTSPKGKAPTTKPAKTTASAKTTPSGSKKTTTTATGTTTVSTTTGTWTPTNPVATKLSTKPNLLARIKNSLPLGTDLNLATVGFKNFGQFVAATNVSSNLGIDFWSLKASMTGFDSAGLATGQPTLSLGQSIQKLKTGVDGTAEAQRAETLANQMIADSGN